MNNNNKKKNKNLCDSFQFSCSPGCLPGRRQNSLFFFRHIMKQTHIYAHERKKNTQQQIEINDSIEFWFFFLWLQTHKHNNHRWFRTKVQYIDAVEFIYYY